jgi:hypothetical protein
MEKGPVPYGNRSFLFIKMSLFTATVLAHHEQKIKCTQTYENIYETCNTRHIPEYHGYEIIVECTDETPVKSTYYGEDKREPIETG